MSLFIYVDLHPGHKANARPCRFDLDDEIYDIVSIEDRWREPNATFFVQTVEDNNFVLRYGEPPEDEWTLQSGFHGDELLARKKIHLITIGVDVMVRAEGSWPDASDADQTKRKVKFCAFIAVVRKKWIRSISEQSSSSEFLQAVFMM